MLSTHGSPKSIYYPNISLDIKIYIIYNNVLFYVYYTRYNMSMSAYPQFKLKNAQWAQSQLYMKIPALYYTGSFPVFQIIHW